MFHYKAWLEKNSDGTFDAVIYINSVEDFSVEFAKELSKGKGWNRLKDKKLRFIKIILAGTLILSIPFSQVVAKRPAVRDVLYLFWLPVLPAGIYIARAGHARRRFSQLF